MQRIFLLIIFCCSVKLALACDCSFCKQTSKGTVRLEIVSYKDSVFEEPDAKIKLRLINESDTAFTFNGFKAYFIIVLLDSCRTINTDKFLEKIDGPCLIIRREVLRPGDSLMFETGLNLLGYGERGLGNINMKVLYKLNDLNMPDAETGWIRQFFPKHIPEPYKRNE